MEEVVQCELVQGGSSAAESPSAGTPRAGKRAPKQESANIQGPVKPRDQELNQFICLQP